MEQDAIRPPAGLVAFDHHSRLRIDHHHGIVVQVSGVEQAPVGRKCHVADEIARRALIWRDHGKRARRSQLSAGEAEFKHRRARPAAHIHPVALRCKGESQPAIRHRHARDYPRRRRLDDADRWWPVPTVERQQILAVRRERRGHRKGVERHLLAHGREAPPRIEQERAIRQRPYPFPGRRLGAEQRPQRNERDNQTNSSVRRHNGMLHVQLTLYGVGGLPVRCPQPARSTPRAREAGRESIWAADKRRSESCLQSADQNTKRAPN